MEGPGALLRTPGSPTARARLAVMRFMSPVGVDAWFSPAGLCWARASTAWVPRWLDHGCPLPGRQWREEMVAVMEEDGVSANPQPAGRGARQR